MKLKEFNTETTVVGTYKAPSIHINTLFGVFHINKQAQELIGIKEGSQIVIHQDEDEPENWFLEKVDEKGFALKKRKDQTTLQLNHSGLARTLVDGIGGKGRVKFLVAGKATEFDGRTLWGLLKLPE